MTREFYLQGLKSPIMLGCHLAAVGLAVVFVFILSRYERKLVSRRLGNGLLALRMTVLTVILFTLLQPTISWTFNQKQPGRILVGIDVSDSMATIDRHASNGEKFRVARGLELIGNAAHNERLDRWQHAFDANQQPEWVEPTEDQDDNRRTALERSRREHLISVFQELEKLPRTEIARRVLVSSNTPVLDQLNQLGRVELFVFAGKSESVERDQLAKVVATPPTSLSTNVSDLSIGLQRGATGGDVAGIVLLTDGRDHSGQNLPAMAAALKSTNSPVYPILIGSSYRSKDISILLLEHPQSVYKGDHPQVKATIATVGFEGKSIDVELVSEDEPNSEPLRRSVVSKDASVVVEFDLNAEKVGRRTYLVRTPVQEGETRDDNNSRSFSLNVVDDRAKVLIIDGEARWEFRYLDAALSRDDRVDLKKILFEQPFLGVLREPFFPNQLKHPVDPTDLTVSPFAETDLVIVGDVPPDKFTDSAWKLLLKFVSEGGTLVLSAGTRHMPLSHRSTALDQLLPVTKVLPINLADKTQETMPLLRGIPLKLTSDGEQQSMLQFAPDLPRNIAIWNGLPGQTWAMLGEAKPSATVWATTLVPAGRIDGLTVDRKFAAIVHQFVGSGQVVWLGFNATWRWRYRVGDKFHHRFWAQLARWAAANKMAAGTDFVRFGPEKAELERGQEARVRARWTSAFLQKFPKLKAHAEFIRRGEQTNQPFTTIDLTPMAENPFQHEGRVLSLPAGEYQVKLTADEAILGDKPIETTIFVHDKPSQELNDVSTNRDLLAQIADLSGGRLFQVDEVQDLPKMFKKEEETTAQSFELAIWDRWPWLILLFSLMTSEWVIRKLNGLP